jgi:DNA primase
MSVAEDIKAKLDIVSYIQQYAPLKKAGRTYKACCPFHSERTPSFVVNGDTQSWRCFGACAEGGDVFNFAMKMHGWTFGEAIRELGKQVGIEVQQQSPAQKAQDEKLDGLRGLLQAAADFYHQRLLENESALAYARHKRGFSDETLRQYQIGYAPQPPPWDMVIEHLKLIGYDEKQIIEVGLARQNDKGHVYDYFRNRLMIPIRDERGRVIGFGARALAADDNPKYLNSPQTPLFDKSHTLFGLDVAKRTIRDQETAVIVEGYMDALQAHQAGFTNVIAQMGTALTEAQLKLIAPRYAKKIILALDSDAAGQNATMRSLEVARAALQADYSGKLSVDMRVLQIPGAKDPDDLIRESPERWQELVNAAVPVADYVIEVEVSALPQQASLQEREAVARRLLPILLASESNLYKQDNLQKLALKLHINEKDLLNWAQEQKRIERAKPPRRMPPEAEPPDFPPQNDDDALAPQDAEDYAPFRSMPRRIAPSRDGTRREMDCLRALLQQPDLLYHINRKFREIAAGDSTLLAGPLRDFGLEDFSHSDYRALMRVFQAAMEQDEMESADYLQANLDERLRQELVEILIDDLETLRPKLRHGLSIDLTMYLKQQTRINTEADFKVKLIENALSLRKRRLDLERTDLSFIIADSQMGSPQQFELHIRANLSNKARGLIDAELQRQAKIIY